MITKLPTSMSMLSPKANCVQVYFLSSYYMVKWNFCDPFTVYSMSHTLFHISEVECANFQFKCLHCHQKPVVCKYTSLATTVQSTGSFVTERFWSLWCESYSVFHVLEAKPARFQSQVFTLSPKASCVDAHHLATTVQKTGILVTDRFKFTLRMTLCLAHIRGTVQGVCLSCHKKPAVCKYTSLATTVQ